VSIKFVCSCGKHLKARDEMAERLSVCPRCGSLVGIPPRKPRHPEAALPPAVQPSRTLGIGGAAVEPAAPSRDSRITRLLSLRRDRRPNRAGRHLEEHWYECLLYPLRAWPLCLAMAIIITPISAGITLLLPSLIAEPPDDPWTLGAVRLSGAMLLLLIVGLPGDFLNHVLMRSCNGEVELMHAWGNPLFSVMLSGMKWVTCFLAGPVIFAAAAVAYWLDCGDVGVLDWLILGELGIVAIAYQIFALLALTDRGRLRDLNPLAVADLAHRLGWRSLVGVLVAAALLLMHVFLFAEGIGALRSEPAMGWTLLAVGWISGMFCGTFLCRLFGIWCYRSRKPAAAPMA
jgi:hypothetical protein